MRHSRISGADDQAPTEDLLLTSGAESCDKISDSAPSGAPRSYPGFSAAAAQAGRSRVFGGQHFEFSNQAGLGIGRGVAGEVLATRLLRDTGPTHFGACPR